MIFQVELFSFVFLEELKKPKRHFEINWPLNEPRDEFFQNSAVHTVKSKGKILQNFGAFSEYMNFIELAPAKLLQTETSFDSIRKIKFENLKYKVNCQTLLPLCTSFKILKD